MKRFLILLAMGILLVPAGYGLKRSNDDRLQAANTARIMAIPQEEADREQVARTKVYEGTLRQADPRRFVSGLAIETLDRFPPLQAMHGDGLRMTGYTGAREYAVAMSLAGSGASTAQGILLIIDTRNPRGRNSRAITAHPFSMPRAEYLSLMRAVDDLMDDYPGSAEWARPGVDNARYYLGGAFERVRGQKILSGHAISEPQYEKLDETVFRRVSKYAGVPWPSTWSDDDNDE